jgi:hypothetical protein
MTLGISENETLASVSFPFFEMPCGFLSSLCKQAFLQEVFMIFGTNDYCKWEYVWLENIL